MNSKQTKFVVINFNYNINFSEDIPDINKSNSIEFREFNTDLRNELDDIGFYISKNLSNNKSKLKRSNLLYSSLFEMNFSNDIWKFYAYSRMIRKLVNLDKIK